jgi:hypothetical protein
MSDLPYVDEHQIRIAASRDVVWPVLRRYVDAALQIGPRSPLPWLLGTRPRGGFEVSQEVPGQLLGMAGRHRFSRYLLQFELADTPDGATTLTARSYAAFPGLPGWTYRTLVIGTRGHVLAVRHLLRSIRGAVSDTR